MGSARDRLMPSPSCDSLEVPTTHSLTTPNSPHNKEKKTKNETSDGGGVVVVGEMGCLCVLCV